MKHHFFNTTVTIMGSTYGINHLPIHSSAYNKPGRLGPHSVVLIPSMSRGMILPVRFSTVGISGLAYFRDKAIEIESGSFMFPHFFGILAT